MTGFPESSLEKLISALRAQGYEPHLTSIGGSGLGVLAPRPNELAKLITGEGTVEQGTKGIPVLRGVFEGMEKGGLERWAEGRGRWLYV